MTDTCNCTVDTWLRQLRKLSSAPRGQYLGGWPLSQHWLVATSVREAVFWEYLDVCTQVHMLLPCLHRGSERGWGIKFEMIKCRTTDIPEFQITNFKIAKDKLFDYFIYEFISLLLFFKITWTLKVFDNFFKL